MNDAFLKACHGERVEQIPVWFMRQAGRSLPKYREFRKQYDVLTLTRTPELAAQVSREPVDRHGVDAAILFADIMLLPIAMGIEVEIIDSIGPVIDDPINTPDDIKRLQHFTQDSVYFLGETIRILKDELAVPIIGFSGAPFTLASYLIEGKPTRNWQKTKQFMFLHPEAWHTLMTVLSEATVEYLRAQIEAGADAVQIFDSWVGCLSPDQYREHVEPHMRYIFDSLKELNVPRILFGTNTAGMLHRFKELNCDVIGVDWRITLKDAKAHIGEKALQGNLDPVVLLSDWSTVKKEVDRMFAEIDPKIGYIFNLGHGVLPETDETMIRKLVEYVHEQ